MTEGSVSDFLQARDYLLSPIGTRGYLPAATLRSALTELYDLWLSTLAEGAGIGEDSPYALLAVGSLGRREQSPHSDLDLVLVYDPSVEDEVAAIADALWYPIWDAKITLDHSVRTVEGCVAVADNDLAALLGLLEARHIVGSRELGESVISGVASRWRSNIIARFDEVIEETELRHRRSGLIAHTMEPDLKNGEGGLRDLQLLSALARAHITDGVAEPHPDSPGAGAAQAHRLLLDVRTELHRLTGKARNVVYAQDADDIAHALGIGDRFDLLRALSDASRTISFQLGAGLRTARQSLPARGLARLRRLPVRKPLDEGVVNHNGEVTLARDERVSRDPGLIIRVAAAAARSHLPISASTLRRLADQAPEPALPWAADSVGDLLVVLGSGNQCVEVIEALDRSGLWGRLLPEWGAVRDLPSREKTHVYTVDRHLVQTVVEASAVATSVARPDLLLLSALLHDIGKGRGRDHSEVGAELAKPICLRLGLSPADIETVRIVVLHHLIFVKNSTRRDPADIASAREILLALGNNADAVDILAALTPCDARATGPGVWSDWKQHVHEILVNTVRSTLENEREQELALGSNRWMQEIAPPQLMLDNPSWAAPLDGAEVRLSLQATSLKNTHTIEVQAPNTDKSVTAIVAALTVHGFDIIDADFVSGDEKISARVVGATRFGVPADTGLIRQDVRRSLHGLPLGLRRALDRRTDTGSYPAVAPPQLRLIRPASVPIRDALPRPESSSPDSPDSLVVIVRTEDRPGLLAAIIEIVNDQHGHIQWLKVRTRGSSVDDCFAITGIEQSRHSELREALLGVVPSPQG